MIFYYIRDAKTNKEMFASTCARDIKREMIRQARHAVTLWHGDDYKGKFDWVNFRLQKVG